MADSPRIEELKRRVQLDPASIAFAALAEEYRRAERYNEAIDTCTAGLVRHPSYLSAHVTLGRSLMEVGRLQEAQQELEFVLKLAPENLAAIRGLADIHHRLGVAHEHHEYHAEQTPAPAVHLPAAPPPPAIAVAEVQAASGAFTFIPSEGRQEVTIASPERRDDPVMAGLEQFLNAIMRARTERSVAR